MTQRNGSQHPYDTALAIVSRTAGSGSSVSTKSITSNHSGGKAAQVAGAATTGQSSSQSATAINFIGRKHVDRH
jgi:hypothetical protein